jgi:hypothetical protein
VTPYTVIVQNLDKTAAVVRHATAHEPRQAYLAVLKTLYDESEQDPATDPYDPVEAEHDRPLLCIFVGHHTPVAP